MRVVTLYQKVIETRGRAKRGKGEATGRAKVMAVFYVLQGPGVV